MRAATILSVLSTTAIALPMLVGSCFLPADFVKTDSQGVGGAGASAPERPIGCLADDEPSWHCGPTADTDCCETRLVEEGNFSRSYDGTPEFNDDSHTAWVSSFYLDTYEVTVARFRAFVEGEDYFPAGGDGAHPGEPESGWWDGWNSELPANAAAFQVHFADCAAAGAYVTWQDTRGTDDEEALPINCVDWFMAFAFCVWDGGRLPSESEWNYAAAGGDEQRLYPWGADAPTPNHAVWGCDDGVGCDPSDEIQPAGARQDLGESRWGQANLAGNLAEWTLDEKDWTDENGTPTSGTSYNNHCDDCVEIDADIDNPEDDRAIRGGLFFSRDPLELRVSNHFSFPAEFQGYGTGMRCARDVE